MTARLLTIENLSTHLDTAGGTVRAVDGVTLHVDEGEILGIVGESGCGKSMTAFSVVGLLPSNGDVVGGAVEFAGQDLVRLGDKGMRRIRGNEISMVFQDPMTSLDPTMTIGDQVEEPLKLHRRSMTAQQRRERVLETLGLAGVPSPAERLKQYPHQLSGGLRQRVAIAIALVCRPRLIIADEPTTALDVTIQRQILDLLDHLRHELGVGVVLVTHDLGVIAEYADRVAVMYAGQIVETGTTAEIFARPRHRYTEGLFNALPERAASTAVPLISISGFPPDLSRELTGCRFAERCTLAQDLCRTEAPPLVEEGRHGHRCHFPASRDIIVTATPPKAELAARAAADGVASPPTSEEPDLVVEVHNLVKTYPLAAGSILRRDHRTVHAISGIDLAVPRAATFGLVGESGCGKSTVSKIITALERPDSGAVRIDGTNIAGQSRRALRRWRRHTQLMFQDPYAAMDPRMAVADILMEPFVVQAIGTPEERRSRIAELLDQVSLPAAFGTRFPHELSGGQRQRLALARALALRPNLVVADEPVSALDVSVQAQILNLMKDLQRDLRVSYVFVSHDLSVVRYMASEMGVMYLGKMVEVGPAGRVYSSPAHPYTRGLVDSVPVAEVRDRDRVTVHGELGSAIDPPPGCRFHRRCPLATDRCKVEEPLLRPVVAGGSVACHYPLVPVVERPVAAGGVASIGRRDRLTKAIDVAELA